MTADPPPPVGVDADRQAIVEMLYDNDTAAYVRADWSAVEDDFDADAFVGWFREGSEQPLQIRFSTLDDYRDFWLSGAKSMLAESSAEELEADLLAASRIADIEFQGKWALVRKEFDGYVGPARERLLWTTYYHCRRDPDRWRITGFTALFPDPSRPATKRAPVGGARSSGAPYSPALIVPAGDLVAIAGQGPLDEEGNLVGATIEEHTAKTLENCRLRLAEANCTFDDVFKVMVYMQDLSQWDRMNEVYRRYFGDPQPTRTTLGVNLLGGMLIEIDMLARQPGVSGVVRQS